MFIHLILCHITVKNAVLLPKRQRGLDMLVNGAENNYILVQSDLYHRNKFLEV